MDPEAIMIHSVCTNGSAPISAKAAQALETTNSTQKLPHSAIHAAEQRLVVWSFHSCLSVGHMGHRRQDNSIVAPHGNISEAHACAHTLRSLLDLLLAGKPLHLLHLPLALGPVLTTTMAMQTMNKKSGPGRYTGT